MLYHLLFFICDFSLFRFIKIFLIAFYFIDSLFILLIALFGGLQEKFCRRCDPQRKCRCLAGRQATRTLILR